MEIKELLDFVDLESQRLFDHFDKNSWSKKEIILTHTVKVTEELGELCSEVLAFNKNQRPEKMENHDAENLSHEFADVIITTLLLAKSMDIDIQEALKNKIVKINQRYL
jgi:NTP pyrophosphatase (non-canonical NTP hydrolase)